LLVNCLVARSLPRRFRLGLLGGAGPICVHRPVGLDAIARAHARGGRKPFSALRRPGALLITAIAATDVAYRLLLRAPIRRGLGIKR